MVKLKKIAKVKTCLRAKRARKISFGPLKMKIEKDFQPIHMNKTKKKQKNMPKTSNIKYSGPGILKKSGRPGPARFEPCPMHTPERFECSITKSYLKTCVIKHNQNQAKFWENLFPYCEKTQNKIARLVTKLQEHKLWVQCGILSVCSWTSTVLCNFHHNSEYFHKQITTLK